MVQFSSQCSFSLLFFTLGVIKGCASASVSPSSTASLSMRRPGSSLDQSTNALRRKGEEGEEGKEWEEGEEEVRNDTYIQLLKHRPQGGTVYTLLSSQYSSLCTTIEWYACVSTLCMFSSANFKCPLLTSLNGLFSAPPVSPVKDRPKTRCDPGWPAIHDYRSVDVPVK